MKNLVIVESPAKTKTIKKYLGKDFEVLASYGHVRDLIPKEGAVLPEDDFAMKYDVISRNSKHVDAICKALKKADTLYLATDPDREGEAISWHLYELIKTKKGLADKPVLRVVFNEITKKAITEAMNNPRELSLDLVHAQQARRALDYLVGFNLSPVLWKKIRRGLSAGRVQSPALRMICERELEIEKFESQEYWTIGASLSHEGTDFIGKLIIYQQEKLKQFSINNEEQALNAKSVLSKATNGHVAVKSITPKQRKRKPTPPFITSTMQQEAARKLGFGAGRTMRVAQQLYEGVDLGGETVGLITYMRTDSVNLSNDALDDIRSYIKERYGASQMPKEPRAFKTKSKNAQEAHEAIRHTSSERTPESVKAALTPEQYKLYSLIFKRTIACQMIDAVIDSVTIDFDAGGEGVFRSTGSQIKVPGFLSVYQESEDDSKGSAIEEKDGLLPEFELLQLVDLKNIEAKQHFTEPPPRYSEASLVKSLEEHGIGRPSTYATIISTLQQREYVILDKKRFTPTDVGSVVNKFLTQYFSDYVDYQFTAKLEDSLDDVSRGETQYLDILHKFWVPFKDQVAKIAKEVKRSDVTQEPLDENCPKCGKQLSIRLGRNGRFIGCSAYPECDYTRNIVDDSEELEKVDISHACPKCGGELVVKRGRYGAFIGCSNYPDCNHMEPIEKPKDTDVTCPQCNKGNILERRSRRGKIFYSCERYPDCDYAIWDAPIKESCPDCSWPILTLKTTKKRGTEKVCPQKACSYRVAVDEDDDDSDGNSD